MRIAILEDDEAIASTIKFSLEDAGFHCHVFKTSRKLIAQSSRETFDLFLFDWTLPDLSGVDVLRKLKQEHHQRVPVIFVTVRNAEEDIVEVLDIGADDFIVKPVRRVELVARVKAVLRRYNATHGVVENLSFPPYEISISSRRLKYDGVEIPLTQKEFELVVFMFQNMGKLLSRSHISELIWGTSTEMSRTIDTHASRIRKKLNLGEKTGYRLVPIYNVGYRLERISGQV